MEDSGMNRVSLIAGLLVAIALLASACASANRAPEPSMPADAPAGAPQSPAFDAPKGEYAGGSNSGAVDRMVIYTASLRLVVPDVDRLLTDVSQLAREMGGHVVSSESQEWNGDRTGRASIRVPAERLDETLDRIKGMAARVDRSAISAKDVTEEFVDQEARLRTLRATEEQYLQLLTSARTVEDTLRVQQSLFDVREQIERSQGRIQYLRQSSETALISMEVSTAAGARPIDPVGWDAQATLVGALQGLVAVAFMLASLAIWVIVFIPVWVPALLFVRWWRGRRRSAPPVSPVPGAG
jgi:hypothetical protein